MRTVQLTVHTDFTERLCNTGLSHSEAVDYNLLCNGVVDRYLLPDTLTREMVKYWRSKALKVIMYLDDENYTFIVYSNASEIGYAGYLATCNGVLYEDSEVLGSWSNLLDQGSSDSVISAIIYSVKWIHKINNLPNPCENGIVQNLLESTKRVASK
ncbi:hypothetical protein KUTeg_012324, partial [Tegillarca granosa]